MYSIVETGGFQYKVELGKAYKVPCQGRSSRPWQGRHDHRVQEEASYPLRTS